MIDGPFGSPRGRIAGWKWLVGDTNIFKRISYVRGSASRRSRCDQQVDEQVSVASGWKFFAASSFVVSNSTTRADLSPTTGEDSSRSGVRPDPRLAGNPQTDRAVAPVRLAQ